MADKSGRLSVVQRAAMWAARKAFGGTYPLTDHDAVSRLLGYGNSAGVPVTEQTAMQISAVWSCVRVLSETVGALPWAFYERDDAGNMRKVDHDLGAVLLESPNSAMTSQELRENQMTRLGLAGNAYCWIERGRGERVISIEPDPRIRPVVVEGRLRYKRGSEPRYLPDDQVWHLKGFGDGVVGYSPLAMARQAFGLAMATESFGARFFKDGASAAGIVKVKEWLTDDQREQARKILGDMWSGLANAHKAQLLEGGMDYQSVTMPLEDAQFLQTRKFQVTEICRWYRVPPHLVADLERATFSNIEQQALEFVQYTLMPYFVRYEQTARKLLPLADRRRVVLRFNVDGLLRGDSAGRAGLYSVLLQNGVYSRNEVRALENRPRSEAPGMDDFTVQSNMQQTGQLGKDPQP